MNFGLRKLSWILIVAWLALCASYLNAAEPTKNKQQASFKSKQKQLKTLNQKIKAVSKLLTVSNLKYQQETNTLQQIDFEISSTAKKIQQINVRIRSVEAVIAKIIKEKNIYQAKHLEQQNLLFKQYHLIYKLGKQPLIKIVLSQDDPEKIARYLRYYAILSQARIETINKIKKISTYMENLEQQQVAQSKKLQAIQQEQQTQQAKLLQQQQRRKQFLLKLNREIKINEQVLKKLNIDKRQLTEIIKKLRTQEVYTLDNKNFSGWYGKLTWPVEGEVIQKFNDPLLDGRVNATGIIIRAKAGAPVRSVFPGKVVFADWLSSFGMLIIVQHDKQYMTVYGHNQSLYVASGDIVEAGQIISTAGNSGSNAEDSLYFEIRNGAKPLDPMGWLKK